MTDERIEIILERIREKLQKKEVPDTVTGKIIVNLACGNVSGNVKLEISL